MDGLSLVYTLSLTFPWKRWGQYLPPEMSHRKLCEGILPKGKWTSKDNFGIWGCPTHRTSFWNHKSTFKSCNGSFPVTHTLSCFRHVLHTLMKRALDASVIAQNFGDFCLLVISWNVEAVKWYVHCVFHSSHPACSLVALSTECILSSSTVKCLINAS